MTSIHTCVGVIQSEPKRYYLKDGTEVSGFRVSVKRSDKTNKWDVLRFEAFNNEANYINKYLHAGDVCSFVSRPLQKFYKNRKGDRTEVTVFKIISLNFICSKERFIRYNFGSTSIQEFPEMQEYFE